MEHLRASGAYWGLTTLDLLHKLHAVDASEVVDWIMSCYHPESVDWGATWGTTRMSSTCSAPCRSSASAQPQGPLRRLAAAGIHRARLPRCPEGPDQDRALRRQEDQVHQRALLPCRVLRLVPGRVFISPFVDMLTLLGISFRSGFKRTRQHISSGSTSTAICMIDLAHALSSVKLRRNGLLFS